MQWSFPSIDEARLRIELATRMLAELDPITRKAVCDALCCAEPQCVLIDVTRRGGGAAALRTFVVPLMLALDGVALDDNSDHVWTSEDIERGASQDGRTFAHGYDSL